MTQLSRVDPKSARHLRSTPSSMPSSPLGSSIRRRRISLKFLRTCVGEWWVTPASESSSVPTARGEEEVVEEGDVTEEEEGRLGPRN